MQRNLLRAALIPAILLRNVTRYVKDHRCYQLGYLCVLGGPLLLGWYLLGLLQSQGIGQ